MKRARSSSFSVSSSASSTGMSRSRSSSPSLDAKILCSDEPSSTSPSRAESFQCTLPPTCHRPGHATTLRSTELESHHAKFHTWVCQAEGQAMGSTKKCNKVFPDARILELHQTECHDPIASLRKDRGEKIFACFLPPELCQGPAKALSTNSNPPRSPRSKLFLTPKARRLHLIAAHGYPKEYFFSVVNKGVGELLDRMKKGDAAMGMVRGEWKQRETTKKDSGVEGEHADRRTHRDKSAGSSVTEALESEDLAEQSSEPMVMDMDTLTTSFRSFVSISAVPSAIRFGRRA